MGKNKYIESPEKFWELFQEYRKETKNNPFLLHDYVGKDGLSAHKEKERCLTLDGFEEYVADKGIIQDLGDYFANTNENYNEYSTICTRVKRAIRRDQIEGGMAGVYNPSITQRLNGLVDKKETEIKGGLNIPELPDIGNRE